MACRAECEHVRTRFDYWATLDVYGKPNTAKLTGIIGTIGPKSRDAETIEKMIRAGMDVVRVNLWQCHDDFQEIVNTINDVLQKLTNDTGIPRVIGIAMDTQGREIKYGNFDNEEHRVKLCAGQTFTLTGNKDFWDKGDDTKVAISFPELGDYVKPGMKVYLDFGTVAIKITGAGGTDITGTVENDGTIYSQGSVNVPGVDLDLPLLTEDDIENITYGIEHNADLIFASFVNDPDDIKCFRSLLGDLGQSVAIFSKIENREALINLDEIIKVSDGVIVARGDLGIETPPQKLCLIQSHIITHAIMVGKPVIVGAGILSSMVSKPRPTKAELSDLFSIVLQGAGSIMFTKETAFGDYPVQTIALANNICREAETARSMRNIQNTMMLIMGKPVSPTLSTAGAVVTTATNVKAQLIIVLTTTGGTAHDISAHSPCCPIIAITRNVHTARKASLYRGVIPLWYKYELLPEWRDDVKYRFKYALTVAECEHYIVKKDNILLVYGDRPGAGHSNVFRVFKYGVDNILQLPI